MKPKPDDLQGVDPVPSTAQGQPQDPKPVLPEALKEDKTIKTMMTDLKTVINLKLDQLQDLATLEIMLDVHTRLQKRLESIRKLSSATHLKIVGHWKTTPPKMHIAALKGKKLNNNEAVITFGVYQHDKKGNKLGKNNYADVELPDGSIRKRVMSVEYPIEYEVTETIRQGKPITREVMYIERKTQEVEE